MSSRRRYYGGFFDPTQGTFGNGHFCGRVRTPVFRSSKAGQRRVVRFRTHRACRFPRDVTRNVTLTFTIA